MSGLRQDGRRQVTQSQDATSIRRCVLIRDLRSGVRCVRRTGHTERRVLFLLMLIALKYPALEMCATSRRAGVRCFLAILEALWNSRGRVVRWGVHQGLE